MIFNPDDFNPDRSMVVLSELNKLVQAHKQARDEVVKMRKNNIKELSFDDLVDVLDAMLKAYGEITEVMETIVTGSQMAAEIRMITRDQPPNI